MEADGGRVCGRGGSFEGLCHILSDEEALHPAGFPGCLQEYEKMGRIPDFLGCIENHCPLATPDRLYDYLRLYGESGR